MKATILLLFLFLSLNASAYVKDTTFVVNTAENTYEISFFSQHVRIDNVKIRNPMMQMSENILLEKYLLAMKASEPASGNIAKFL
mgnify:CR=1 FL=1